MTFSVNLRVRYAETDQMGIVHHSVYFVWFEHLRTEYFRAMGLPYGELEADGVLFPVLETGCRHKEGARYDGEVCITGWIREPKGARLRIDYRVEQKGRLLAEGFTIHVRTDPDGRPGRIPAAVLKKLKSDSSPPGEGPSI